LIELSGVAKFVWMWQWVHVYENLSREAASLRIQRDLRMYLAKKAYKDLYYSTILIETGMSGMATLQRAYKSGNYDPGKIFLRNHENYKNPN